MQPLEKRNNGKEIESIVSPRTRVTNFKPIQKRKTAHGIILGLNQKFKKDVAKDPQKSYSAMELSILFGEKVSELNLAKKGSIPTEEKNKELKQEGSRCAACGQRIKQSMRRTLSKNLINTLWIIHQLSKEKGFMKTKEIYTKINTSSPTAELTNLKYIGAIYPHFDKEDYEKESTRSGKWAISEKGLKFLKKRGSLPFYVIVKDEEIIEYGEDIFIDDEKLKWQTEEEIWKDLKDHWKTEDDLKV